MDPDLKSASKYVNNMLAARGLLRGDPIDFARPSRDEKTPARIINLVHELVQRRDREAEQRENMALAVRNLQNADTKHVSTIEGLKSKNAELERKIALLEGNARSFTSTLHTVEASAKSLRDDNIRQKTLLAQVRMQCANDIRKRDLQIQKMKERLQDTQRGTRRPIAQIIVTGSSTNGSSTIQESDSGPSLSQDTADFLTTLSQTLSDENDTLIILIQQCIFTLKEIQGLPDAMHLPETEHEAGENPLTAPPATHEALSAELERTMESLRDLVNQPNYVPLEELEERDTEIARLSQQNETLQEEWKNAIALIDEWNKTLARGASPIKPPQEERALAELSNGHNQRGSVRMAENLTEERVEWEAFAGPDENDPSGEGKIEEVEEAPKKEKRRKSMRTKSKQARLQELAIEPTKRRRSARLRGSAPITDVVDTSIVIDEL